MTAATLQLSDHLCECGCGEPAPIATKTDRRDGSVKGQPKRFLPGHNGRTRKPPAPPQPEPEPEGYRRTQWRRDELLDEWAFMRETCTYAEFPARVGLKPRYWQQVWLTARRDGDPRAVHGAADRLRGRGLNPNAEAGFRPGGQKAGAA